MINFCTTCNSENFPQGSQEPCRNETLSPRTSYQMSLVYKTIKLNVCNLRLDRE